MDRYSGPFGKGATAAILAAAGVSLGESTEVARRSGAHGKVITSQMWSVMHSGSDVVGRALRAVGRGRPAHHTT